MAVLVSNGPTSLATAGGFYRAEAFNLGMFSTTDLALSTTRTIAVTFANAGACQGLILAMVCSATTATLKSVVVTLQENVASVWTDRATVTLSAATIANNVTNAQSDGWIVPFTGGTFPYTVTTAAATWRFQISQTGAEVNSWSIRTSDATNPFYVTWCNNSLSFTSGADVVVCKDVVTIDQTATFKGVLGTGDTTRSVCAIVCRSTTPTPDDVANLVWQNPPSASYTLSLDGLCVSGTHSGVRVGTDADPIPLAQKAVITVTAATSGTAANTGFANPEHTAGGTGRGASYAFFGAYPAVRSAILSAAAATGQPNIVTTTSTGWATSDRVFVGGFTTRGMGENTVFTINTIAGANIGLSANLGTTARSAKGRVINLTGYGVEIKHSSTTGAIQHPGYCNTFEMRGAFCQSLIWNMAGPTTLVPEDAANRRAHSITYSAFELNPAVTVSVTQVFALVYPPETSWTMDNCNCVNIAPPGFHILAGTDSSAVVLSNTNFVRCGPVNGFGLSASAGWSGSLIGNVFEGSSSSFLNNFSAVNPTITGNRFWGQSTTAGAMFLQTVINPTMGANVFENCATGIRYQTIVVQGSDTDSVFGQEVANGTDIDFFGSSYVNTTIISPTGNLTIGSSGGPISRTLAGTHLRVADFNNTTGDDRGYLLFGNYQRTGSGLSDTTARTAGGFAMRLAPNNATNLLAWPNLVSERAVPTGNIQNKTMTVTAWVYINSAAFYAGTHTKPTLSVKYDNATTASAVATATAGSWQQLAVTFTPATTYGQIEVWFSGATDATGANAYFYVDDVQVAYPAGVSINLGGLDLWANATPVWPPIATFPALGGVWDEATSAHTVPGSMAAQLAEKASAAAVAAVQAAVAALPSSVDTAAAIRADQVTELLRIIELAKLHGLDPAAPLVVTPTTRTAGSIEQSIGTVGDVVTVTRTA